MEKEIENAQLFNLMESVIGYDHSNTTPVPVLWILERLEEYMIDTRQRNIEVYGHYTVHNLKRLEINLEWIGDSVYAYLGNKAVNRLMAINELILDDGIREFIDANQWVKDLIRKEKVLLIEGISDIDSPSEVLPNGSCCRRFHAADKDLCLSWESDFPFHLVDNTPLTSIDEKSIKLFLREMSKN